MRSISGNPLASICAQSATYKPVSISCTIWHTWLPAISWKFRSSWQILLFSWICFIVHILVALYEHPNPFRHCALIGNIASGLIRDKAKSCSARLLGRAEECKSCSKYILLSVMRWMHLASSLWFWKYSKNSALGSPGFTAEQFITLLPGSALFQMEIYFAQSLTCRSSQW